MRLADQIIESRFPGWRPFAERIRQAVRFEVAPEVGAMAHAIKQSNAKRLRAAMEFCRMPFDVVWFEWVGPAATLGVVAPDEAADPLRPVPGRMGFLVEAAQGRLNAGLVSYAWSHGRSNVSVCPLATTFDWGAAPAEVPTLVPERESDAEWVASMRRMVGRFAKDRPDDLLALRGRHGVVPCPHTAELFVRVMAQSPSNAMRWVEDSWVDIRGEQRFAESLLATINCRNLVGAQPEEDLSVLNKARRKLGRPPRLAFRKVVVALSRVQARKARQEAGVGAGRVPLHIVRGHPKVRRTGIYWWSPFWRGDEVNGRVDRTGYEVRA